MKIKTTKKCAIEFAVIGVGLFLVCLVLIFIFPGLYRSQVNKQVALDKGTTAYTMWQDIPLPIYERLYFFNITNPVEFLKHGEKLKVVEVGPYTYKGKWVKNPVSWNPNNTVSYREIRTYHFVSEMSSGSEDDTIMTLNGPAITAANYLKGFSLMFRIAASFFLGIENERLIIKRSIKELAYGGYEDPVIKYGAYIIPHLPYKNGIFSWLYGKNDTDDGMFTVFTGQDDTRLVNMIDKWNGVNNVDLWEGETCNMFNGSSGEMGPPLTEDKEYYTFFQSIFCRSLTFRYAGEITDKGIEARRFVSTEEVFANATDNPDNACFQTQSHLASGVQDVSKCQYGSPVYISFPHFYLADPVYRDMIDGLSPQKENHSAYLDVEPTTGFSVNLRIRFQINLKMERIQGLLQFQQIPEGIFPIFWAEIDVSLTQDLATYLKTQLERPKIIFYTSVAIVMALSVIMIIVSTIVLIRLHRQAKGKDEDDPLLDPGNTKDAVGNRRRDQVKGEPDGAVSNCDGLPEGPSVVSKIKDLSYSGTFDDDVKLLDAGAPGEPYYNHLHGLSEGKR